MTYQWKLQGIIPVSAETAGAELERITNKFGTLEPKTIVDESRAESAPLHKCFEWRDDIAAEKYREQQAGKIVRMLVVRDEVLHKDEPVRAYISIDSSYEPVHRVVNVEDKRVKMLSSAITEMNWFIHKYKLLSELKPVFDSMETFMSEVKQPCIASMSAET